MNKDASKGIPLATSESRRDSKEPPKPQTDFEQKCMKWALDEVGFKHLTLTWVSAVDI